MFAYRTLASIAVLVTLAALAGPVSADSTPPYFEGTPYTTLDRTWEGQTAFFGDYDSNNIPLLTGCVNWIVYAPRPATGPDAVFPSDYAAQYQRPANEFTYVYQVFSTGTDLVHSFSVDLGPMADTQGAFGAGLKTEPETTELDSFDSAIWSFGVLDPNPPGVLDPYPYPPIGQFQNSQILAFSSSYSPEQLWGEVMDGGAEPQISVPSPGSVAMMVPEPSTLWLALAGLGTWAAAWVARRRQGTRGR